MPEKSYELTTGFWTDLGWGFGCPQMSKIDISADNIWFGNICFLMCSIFCTKLNWLRNHDQMYDLENTSYN